MMVKSAILPLAVFLFTTWAFAAEFEVATVKRSPPPESDLININPGSFRNDRLLFANASLSDCLKFAYGIVSDDQISGPDWIKSKLIRFDIVAVPPPGARAEEVPVMLQALLVERLKLSIHHEPKAMPWLALTVAKNGPKLQPAKPDAPPVGPAILGRIDTRSMTTARLALFISRFERQTVLDQTGLSGAWEFKLEWSPPDNPTGPSIFTALEEQLGLRLESRHGPIDVIVVDHADQTPADN
jgi:uncharacterized protein (TIGR03435 family)